MAKLKGGTRIYGLATVDDDLYVGGDIIVTGTVNLTPNFNTPFVNLSGVDPLVDDDSDRGILFNWHTGTQQRLGFFGFDDSTGKLTFIPNASKNFDVITGTKGTIDANLEWADVLNKPDPTISLSLTGAVTGSGSTTLTDLGNGSISITTSIGSFPWANITSKPDPVITLNLSGVITGSGSTTLIDLGNGTISVSTSIGDNSIALGTKTTGNYVATVTGTANQITVSGSGTETAAVTLSLPQNIATTSSPTFASATLTSGGTFSSVTVGSAAVNEINTSSGNLVLDSATGTTVVDDNLFVTGTFTVQGNTVFTNSVFDSSILTIGLTQTQDTNFDKGVVFQWHNGIEALQGFFGFDDSTGSFIYIPDATYDTGTYVGPKGTIDAFVNWTNITNKPDPVITVSLSGDVSGSGNTTLTDLANGTVSISTTIQPNSVALGTDTTGNYVAGVSAGSGITITSGSGEGVTPTISHSDTSSVANLSSDNSNAVVIQDISFVFDTFGHVTSASVSTVDLDSRFINTSGDTMTGFLSLHANPTSALQAATKQYVDEVAQGIVAKPAVRAATDSNLDATYTNGTLGVGAALTSNTNGVLFAIDNVTGWEQYDGILVKSQTIPAQNGRYYVQDPGSPTTPWILIRCGFCDEATEIPSAYVFVQEGTVYKGTGWVAVVDDFADFDVGIDNILWTQFSGAGAYTAGVGLELSDNQFSHADTSSAVNLSAANKTFVSGLTFDTFGHVTGYSTATETDYSISAESAASGAKIRLSGTDSTTDDITLVPGTNVSIVRTDSDTITISSSFVNTTYSISSETAASGATIRLSGSDSSTDNLTLVPGTNVSIVRTDANTITISANDTDVILGTDTTGNYVGALSLGVPAIPENSSGLTFVQTNSGTEGATFTIAHADTSNVGNVLSTENKVVTGIEFDTFGHVTTITATSINLSNPTFDNIAITGNVISSVVADSDIVLAPNGTGLVTIPSAMGIKLGDPTEGSLVSNAVSLTNQDVVTNSIAQLNEVLGKLVPPPPPAFPGSQGISITSLSTYRMTDFVQTDNTQTQGKSVGGGTTVTTVRRANTYTTTTVTTVGPGNTGVVTIYKNGVTAGSRTLITGSDNGTYSNLIISNNVDYGSITGTALGFWESFNCNGSGTVSAGWNEVYIDHSEGTATNNTFWYYDSSTPGTPAFSSVSLAPTVNGTEVSYSSNIPHYTTNTTFTLNFNVNRLSGDMYPTSDVFVVGSAAGAFEAPLGVTYSQAGVTTPLARSLYVSTGSQAVTTTAKVISGFGSSSAAPGVAVSNSYNTGTQSFSPGAVVLYKTGTASAMEETNIQVGSTVGTGSGLVTRIINPGSTDTPTYTSNATTFNSQLATLETYDATIVGAVLKHDQTNYSTGYLPAGPNLSIGRSGSQYFTFKFVRTSVSKFDIKFTGALAGLWVALPGSSIDTTSTLNGWVDMTVPYSGSGVPGAGAGGNGSNGCALGGIITVNSSVTNHRKTCTFGTISSSNTSTNEIYVRIKLTSGQTITALSLETASN
jgi:hypothetical protein